jgi:hypothetical protein
MEIAMQVKFHEVSIESPVYLAGRTEDGEPYVAEAYQVWVTFANGERLIYSQSFPGCEVSVDEEGYEHFADVRAHALRCALRLRRRIRRAGRINPALWVEGRPVYGSPAYCGEDEIALEKREAEEECWR